MSDIKPIAPGDTLRYAFKFRGAAPGPWLATGQTIASRTVTANGGLVKVSDAIVGDDVQFLLNAPSVLPEGTRGTVECEITTNDGETKSDLMHFIVRR